MDEFDLEATPLAADDARTAAESPPAGAGHARGADAAARRSAPRGRAWRALGTVAAVLLALALLWRVVPGAQSGIAGLLHVPAPTPALPIPPGGDVFYWEHAVPWGTLRVDGHAGPDLAIAPTVDRATGYLMPPFFRLPRGEHTLRYSAAQFPPLSCVVFVPDIERDSCREPVAIAGVSPPALVGPPARVLDLGASVDRLPPDALRALVAATQVAVETLDERATVAPGMAYLGADGRSVVAAQPLSASLDARVNVDPRYTQVGFNGPCVSFCDLVGLNTL
ncbi:MAG TPA: hypothetical protein VIG30_08780, partial [Ktedonobacterales bacterium]